MITYEKALTTLRNNKKWNQSNARYLYLRDKGNSFSFATGWDPDCTNEEYIEMQKLGKIITKVEEYLENLKGVN